MEHILWNIRGCDPSAISFGHVLVSCVIKEAIYIKQSAPTMNTDEGYAIYSQIILPKPEPSHVTPLRDQEQCLPYIQIIFCFSVNFFCSCFSFDIFSLVDTPTPHDHLVVMVFLWHWKGRCLFPELASVVTCSIAVLPVEQLKLDVMRLSLWSSGYWCYGKLLLLLVVVVVVVVAAAAVVNHILLGSFDCWHEMFILMRMLK